MHMKSMSAYISIYSSLSEPIQFHISALEDVNCDGDHLLLVGDVGGGQFDMKLKVYKGKEVYRLTFGM